MDIEKLIEFIPKYLAKYFTSFITTIKRPDILLFELEEEIEGTIDQKRKQAFSPDLFGFAILSIILGVVIQEAIPNWSNSSDYFSSVVITLAIWFVFASVMHWIIARNSSSFLTTTSIILQILSVQYVLASLVALLWGVISQVPIINNFLSQSIPLLADFGNYPILVYFVVQTIFLYIYLPYAFISAIVHSKPSSRRFTTIKTAVIVALTVVLWSTFSVIFTQATGIHPLAKFTPIPPLLQCNKPDLVQTPGVLKIVITDFEESVESTSSDLNVEDRLFDSLAQQILGDIVVCRTSQVVGTRIEAHRLGEVLKAALIIWGRRDPTAFEVGFEVADWKLGRVVQRPPKEVRSFSFQTKISPELVALLSELTLSEIYYLDSQVERARDILATALVKATRQELTTENATELARAYSYLGFLFGPASPNSDLERALEAYEQSLALDGTLYAALLNQGVVFEALGKPELAMKAYTRLIKSESPLAAEALVKRAFLYLQWSDRETAEADLEAAIALDPVTGYRGRAQARLSGWNDAKGAIEDLHEVVKREPNNPESYRLLGLVQLQTGQTAEAEQTYRAALPHLDEETQTYILNDLRSLAQNDPELAKDIDVIIAMLETASSP